MLLEPLLLLEAFAAVVDELPPARADVSAIAELEVSQPLLPPLSGTGFVVVDDPPAARRQLARPESELVLVRPLIVVVPFFQGVDDAAWQVSDWLPPDDILRRRPPRSARPRPSTQTAGSGGMGGGGGGGGWRYDSSCVIEPFDETRPEPVCEDLGDTEPEVSIPAKLASVLGKTATGFAIGKAATRMAGEHFGKHGAGIAALASVVATAKLTAKVDKATGVKKVQKLMVAGNVLAAIDDLVELYVPDESKKALGKPKPTGTAKLEVVKDPIVFVQRAKDLGGEVHVKRTQGKTPAGDEAVLLRYTVGGGVPLTLVLYEEILIRGDDGRFDARNTLLAAIRKHRR